MLHYPLDIALGIVYNSGMSRLQTYHSWTIQVRAGSAAVPEIGWAVFRMLDLLRDRGFTWEHLPFRPGGPHIVIRHRSASAGTLLRLSVPNTVADHIIIEDSPTCTLG